MLNRLSPKGLMTALTETCGLKKRLYRMFSLIFNRILSWITFSTLTAYFIYRIAPYNFLYTRYHPTVFILNIPSSSPLLVVFTRSLFDYDSLPYYCILRHPTRSTYFLTHCICKRYCDCDWFNLWNVLIPHPVRAVLYLQLVVEGGAAGRGPSSPEPPSMSLDGSSHVSSMMIEEQETGDTRVHHLIWVIKRHFICCCSAH